MPTNVIPVQTAICSFGMSGKVFHAPFLAQLPQFNFYAVWERTKNEAEKIYPEVKVFRTLEEMLADENIELVIVNTPNSTHFEYAKKALEAGKHVIVEKPFTTSVEEAEELIETAKQTNRLLSVYQNRRFDSDFKTVEKVVNEDLLGDLIEVQIDYYRFRRGLSPKQHKELPIPGAGILYDLGSHIIDQALQLFGAPQALFADIRSVRPMSQVDDCFEILLYYDNLRVRLKASHMVKEGADGYILNGQNGTFMKPKTDVQETDLKRGVLPGTEGWGTESPHEWGLLHIDEGGREIKRYIPSEKGNYAWYYECIYEAIRENGPIPVTAKSAKMVIHIIETAFRSSKEKKVLNLKVEDLF